MQTLIYKKPISRFPLPIPHHDHFFLQNKNHNLLRTQPKKRHYTYTTLTLLCSAASPQSLSYGGWDDFQLTGYSDQSGELNEFHNFLSSSGIGDKKYLFVYLFGFVCALAISRVKVSSIMIFPACAIVFALGFSVGLVKGGHLKESRLTENRKKLIDDTFRGFIDKLSNLGDNLNGCNALVLKVKNGIRRSIESNQVTSSDLEGYIDVLESADISLKNTLDVVESCIQSLSGNQVKEGGSNHESGKKRKKSGENGFSFSQYFYGLTEGRFDGPKPVKKAGSSKNHLMDVQVNNKKFENILASSMKERLWISAMDGDLGNKSRIMSEIPYDSNVRARRVEDFIDGTEIEDIALDNEKINIDETKGVEDTVFDQTMYGYQNKTSRVVNKQDVSVKDYQDQMEAMSSHDDSYNSVDVRISMNHIKTASSFVHQQKRETMHRNYSRFEKTEEGQQEFSRYSHRKNSSPEKRPSFANQEFGQENVFGSSPSSILGNDWEFDRYLAEAKNLFKEAKQCLTQKVDDGKAEHALNRSAILLSKAIEMRPMSLLAVGQLGNTYLLHGELKLRMSRELRSLLVRTDPLPAEEWGEVLNELDERLTNKHKITSSLVNVCEECEELLVKAGRKYKLALSIDRNDMRALYNWGLALSFRAQLISDIGPVSIIILKLELPFLFKFGFLSCILEWEKNIELDYLLMCFHSNYLTFLSNMTECGSGCRQGFLGCHR